MKCCSDQLWKSGGFRRLFSPEFQALSRDSREEAFTALTRAFSPVPASLRDKAE
jgi:hypothetical protein